MTLDSAEAREHVIIGQSGEPVIDEGARWLVDAVDEWRIRSEQPRYDPGWFHASSLGQSDEQLIAAYRGVLSYEQHTARELRVFDNGHDRDGSWKRYLREAGLSEVGEEEARVVTIPWLRLRGSFDDIARDSAGVCYIVEFKTINAYGFSRLTEPKADHLMQTTCYMAGTGIHRSIVLYESKGDQSVRAFYRAFDDILWNRIVARLERLRAEAEAMDEQHDPKLLDLSRRLAQQLADG